MRALIVDDEPLARADLSALLEEVGGVEIAGECANAAEALAALERATPELLFLDIQMPEMDGFELLANIERGELPVVIFTTAFDDHALRAYDQQALDYLLKPIDPARLAAAVQRARKLIDSGQPRERRTRIAAKSGDRTLLVRVEDIDWIEPVSNYAKLHSAGNVFYVRTTMSALEEELDPNRFVRIHRSAIVNVDRIAEVAKSVRQGDFVVVLRDGHRLDMQRSYAARLRALVGRF